MHNLTKTLAAMSLLAPLTAHSLGVGDIKLHSALNQKLNAEIALNLAENEDLADIKVTLAEPEKFEKLGIEWSYFLSKVKFQPILKANGKVVIRMTSDVVVQEPFLDFLVEVSWPKGDIYKEFTVLVDPPVVYQPSKVVAPVATSTRLDSQTVYTDTPAPAAQNDFSSLAVDGEYGPVSRTDSLWKVAAKVNNHSDVSIHQMMMALYKANPRAFYKKNVNALMEGKTLKIPERSEILQLSNKQANSHFNRQMAVWEGKVAPEPNQQIASEAESNSQLKLIPPTADEITGTDTLTANASDTDNSATESLTVENMELQQRLANMEKQMAIMQDMMALKDQQFSALQNTQSSAAQDLNADLAVEQEQQAALAKAEAELEQQRLSAEAALEQQRLSAATTPGEKTAEGTDIQVAVAEVQPEPVKVTPAPKKPAKVPVQEEDSNYFYTGIGLISALAIGGLGWLFWRRRQEEDEINDSSMFASSSEIFLPDTDTDEEDELDVPVFDDSTDYGVATVGESSFLSEFTPSDFDVFESDQAEVDPTSEADVYLAYGRYQQAEELMRQAITEHPENDDFKLKLLEIFYTSENEEAYEGFAAELVAEGKNEDLNFWTKVAEMGKELAPTSALFSADQTESTFEVTDNIISEDTLETIENTDVVADAPVEGVAETLKEAAATTGDSATDFDLTAFSLTDDTGESGNADSELEATDAKNTEENIDFDLSSFETIATSSPDSSESVSLDVDSDAAIEAVEFNADETGDVSLENFDFSTDGSSTVEAQNDSGASETGESKTETAEEQGNEIEFDFDFDEPIAEKQGDSASSAKDDLMVSDLTDMDEFETKIDLANAYIDMGDESSAKEIAKEVIEKGSDEQKQEAQAIVDKLK